MKYITIDGEELPITGPKQVFLVRDLRNINYRGGESHGLKWCWPDFKIETDEGERQVNFYRRVGVNVREGMLITLIKVQEHHYGDGSYDGVWVLEDEE